MIVECEVEVGDCRVLSTGMGLGRTKLTDVSTDLYKLAVSAVCHE